MNLRVGDFVTPRPERAHNTFVGEGYVCIVTAVQNYTFDTRCLDTGIEYDGAIESNWKIVNAFHGPLTELETVLYDRSYYV